MKDHHQQTHVNLQWCSQVITWQMKKRYIFTSTRPIATKLDREVASDGKMSVTKPHNLFITWIYQVTWQIKNAISPIPRDLWPPNLTGLLLMIKGKFYIELIKSTRSLSTGFTDLVKNHYAFKIKRLAKKIWLKRFLKQKDSSENF